MGETELVWNGRRYRVESYHYEKPEPRIVLTVHPIEEDDDTSGHVNLDVSLLKKRVNALLDDMRMAAEKRND